MLALTQRNNILYLELVYLVTALVPSDTACLASSPGKRSLTAVWISLEVMVDLLLKWARRLASAAILSKRSFTKEFIMLMALEETQNSWPRVEMSSSLKSSPGTLTVLLTSSMLPGKISEERRYISSFTTSS